MPQVAHAADGGPLAEHGRPLPGVEVIFFPDPEKGTVGPRATSYTDENGRFTLSTRQSSKAGAIVGHHRICIRDLSALAPAPVIRSEGDEAAPPPPPKRPKRPKVGNTYWDPATTPLRDVEVKAGTQTLSFQLTSEPGSGKWE